MDVFDRVVVALDRRDVPLRLSFAAFSYFRLTGSGEGALMSS